MKRHGTLKRRNIGIFMHAIYFGENHALTRGIQGIME